MSCLFCQDRGVMRVRYQSQEPDDLGLCRCRVGQAFRVRGEAFVRGFLGTVPATARIAPVEDFDELPIVAPSVSRDFTQAGQTRAKAKL